MREENLIGRWAGGRDQEELIVYSVGEHDCRCNMPDRKRSEERQE